jgi:hypothetical protein
MVPRPATPSPLSRGDDGSWLELLAVDEIHFPPGFTNVRGANEGALLGDLSELKASIEVEGVRVPLEILRPAPGVNWVADGFRRLACLRELKESNRKFATVKCHVKPTADPGDLIAAERELVLLNLTSDTGRAPVDVYFFARRVAHILESKLATRDEVCARTGKAYTTIQRYHQVITGLGPEALAEGDAGRLSLIQAQNLHLYDHERQRQILAAAIPVREQAAKDGKDADRAFSQAVLKEQDRLAGIDRGDGLPQQTSRVRREERAKVVRHEKKNAERAAQGLKPIPAPRPTTPSPPVVKPEDQGPPSADVAKRLKALTRYVARLRNLDEVDLVQTLELDTSELSPDAAALYGVLAGLGSALLFLSGATCPDCGQLLVDLSNSRSLPSTHVCEKKA